MLEYHLKQLTEDLELDTLLPQDEPHTFHLRINSALNLTFKEIDPGFLISSPIDVCPEEKREDLFILLSRANFLGQGTGGGTISLGNEEKVLTLSLYLSYDMNYKAFKETVEDFTNYVDYWREELNRCKQASKSILE